MDRFFPGKIEPSFVRRLFPNLISIYNTMQHGERTQTRKEAVKTGSAPASCRPELNDVYPMRARLSPGTELRFCRRSCTAPVCRASKSTEHRVSRPSLPSPLYSEREQSHSHQATDVSGGRSRSSSRIYGLRFPPLVGLGTSLRPAGRWDWREQDQQRFRIRTEGGGLRVTAPDGKLLGALVRYHARRPDEWSNPPCLADLLAGRRTSSSQAFTTGHARNRSACIVQEFGAWMAQRANAMARTPIHVPSSDTDTDVDGKISRLTSVNGNLPKCRSRPSSPTCLPQRLVDTWRKSKVRSAGTQLPPARATPSRTGQV